MSDLMARWMPHRPAVPPDSQAGASAFHAELAENLRRLRAYQEELAGQRQRMYQRHGGTGSLADTTNASCGLPCVVRFEAMTRQPDVTSDQVKQAFRLLAKKCHPDHGGDPALFARLHQAYRSSKGTAALCQSQPA